MQAHKNKAYPLRINEELMDKIKHIAKLEDRSANVQIERILRQYVENYENNNGVIKTINNG